MEREYLFAEKENPARPLDPAGRDYRDVHKSAIRRFGDFEVVPHISKFKHDMDVFQMMYGDIFQRLSTGRKRRGSFMFVHPPLVTRQITIIITILNQYPHAINIDADRGSARKEKGQPHVEAGRGVMMTIRRR